MKAFFPARNREVDFLAFDALGRVYDVEQGGFRALVIAPNASIEDFRIPAIAKGFGNYEASEPLGTTHFQLRLRGATEAQSPVVYEDDIISNPMEDLSDIRNRVVSLDESVSEINAKINAVGTPNVILLPAPVVSGDITLVAVVFDAISFGITVVGASVTLSYVEQRPMVLFGRVEIPAPLVITTKLNNDGSITGVGYAYPSSTLLSRGYKEKYVLDSDDARIKRQLVTIPDTSVFVSTLVGAPVPLPPI